MGMTRRQFLAWSLRGAACALAGYGFLWESNHLQVGRWQVPVSPKHGFLHGLRVGVAADFHLRGHRSEAMTVRAVELLSREAPDLILLPGDFAAMERRYLERSLSILKELDAPLGVYCVPGNHEVYLGMDVVEDVFATHRMVLLRNRSVVLDFGTGTDSGRLVLAGLDDAMMLADKSDVALQERDPDLPVLLMVHEPDAALRHAGAGREIVLQVSGHSHGGQVHLPVWGPPVLPPMGEVFHTGLYLPPEAPHPVFATRGVGSLMGFRLGCPPEVTVVECVNNYVV